MKSLHLCHLLLLVERASRWPHTFRALRHRNFRLFWFGQIVSLTGTWMQTVAQSWLVYRLTDSPLMLGLVNLVGLLPVVPVSLLAGVISDRFPRRNLIIIADIVLMLQALAMAVLIWLNLIQVWHVIALSFILGAAAALEQPARLAFVVDTVGKEDLTNAVALNASVFNTARIVGPPIAGLTVAWVGEAGCFSINGMTYLVIILALLAIRLPPQAMSRTRLKVAGSMAGGFRYVWGTQTIRALMTVVAVSSFFTMSYVALTTVFAQDVLRAGSSGLGFLMMAVGVGAMIGALFVANIQVGHRGKWLTVGNVLGPAVLVLFCFSRLLPLSSILIAVVAASSSVRQTLANSLIQIATPEAYQGRVMSIFNLLFAGMGRVGVLVVGGVAEIVGIAWAVGLGAAVSLIWGLIVIWRMPYVHRLP
jgi:MFS family permease